MSGMSIVNQITSQIKGAVGLNDAPKDAPVPDANPAPSPDKAEGQSQTAQDKAKTPDVKSMRGQLDSAAQAIRTTLEKKVPTTTETPTGLSEADNPKEGTGETRQRLREDFEVRNKNDGEMDKLEALERDDPRLFGHAFTTNYYEDSSGNKALLVNGSQDKNDNVTVVKENGRIFVSWTSKKNEDDPKPQSWMRSYDPKEAKNLVIESEGEVRVGEGVDLNVHVNGAHKVINESGEEVLIAARNQAGEKFQFLGRNEDGSGRIDLSGVQGETEIDLEHGSNYSVLGSDQKDTIKIGKGRVNFSLGKGDDQVELLDRKSDENAWVVGDVGEDQSAADSIESSVDDYSRFAFIAGKSTQAKDLTEWKDGKDLSEWKPGTQDSSSNQSRTPFSLKADKVANAIEQYRRDDDGRFDDDDLGSVVNTILNEKLKETDFDALAWSIGRSGATQLFSQIEADVRNNSYKRGQAESVLVKPLEKAVKRLPEESEMKAALKPHASAAAVAKSFDDPGSYFDTLKTLEKVKTVPDTEYNDLVATLGRDFTSRLLASGKRDFDSDFNRRKNPDIVKTVSKLEAAYQRVYPEQKTS